MAESRMGEEEAYCNLELEMIKEVRENEDVTLANEDGIKTNHSVLDLRRPDLRRLDLRRLDRRRPLMPYMRYSRSSATLNILRCTLHTAHCTLHTAHCTLDHSSKSCFMDFIHARHCKLLPRHV